MSKGDAWALTRPSPTVRYPLDSGTVRRAMVMLGVMALVVAVAQGGAAFSAGSSIWSQVSPAKHAQAPNVYGSLPLAFVPNAGQADSRIRFEAQGSGFAFAFTDREVLLSLLRPGSHGVTLALRFPGARANVAVTGARRLAGRVNYILGSDPARWHTGLPTYGGVVYRNLWPGIDLAFRGGSGVLKYEFRLRPGARPEQIRVAYAGSEGLSLTRDGALAIKTPLGVLSDARPMSYQLIGGRRVAVSSRYVLAGSGYGVALGRGYNPGRATVIDPGLTYSTFLGGSSDEAGFGIAVDKNGFSYVGGLTFSSDFPTTPGAFDQTHNADWDAFVTKLSVGGNALVYSTFLGGSGFEQVTGIAVDKNGNAYVTGESGSADFPTTAGAFDQTYNGGARDAFVTKLNIGGSALVYSTFLGGAAEDDGFAIALDKRANAYVTGRTSSTDFPTNAGAFDPTFNGGAFDAFVTKLNAGGSALVYSTYLGGAAEDDGFAIALDKHANAYVTGRTGSTDFPTTPGAFDLSYNGGSADAFVTKLNAGGSGPVYSTYLGGGAYDDDEGIAVDKLGNAYVSGITFSTDFPTVGAFDSTYNGGGDDHVTKVNAGGSALVYSTYLGGSGLDGSAIQGIAVDKSGFAYVSGETSSTDFPTTAGAFEPVYNGGAFDAFLTKLTVSGSGLVDSTYLGGGGEDQGRGITVDKKRNAYVTGFTGSTDFPITAGAFDETYNGGTHDAFVTKLRP